MKVEHKDSSNEQEHITSVMIGVYFPSRAATACINMLCYCVIANSVLLDKVTAIRGRGGEF